MQTMQLIATIIQSLALIALVWQLFSMRKDRLAQHERARKQATLDKAGPRWAEARFELETQFGRDALAAKAAEEIYTDNELRALVDKLMGTLEHIAVGVNTGVYDADILYRMCSTSIVDNYHRFRPYVELRRRREGDEMYIEVEKIATAFADRRRREPARKGNIEHS